MNNYSRHLPDLLNTYNPIRLYPGVAHVQRPAITSGSGSTVLIASPDIAEDSELDDDTEAYHGRHQRRIRGTSARSARVVGSFDHAVLPMPPVSSSSSFINGLWLDLHSEENRYPCDGFLGVLRYRCQRGKRIWWEDRDLSHEWRGGSHSCGPKIYY